MLRFIFVNLIGVLVINRGNVAQQEEGDKCKMSTGESGACRLIENCPPVYEALKSGELPNSICGFDGIEPIICCPDEFEKRNPSTKVTPLPIDDRRPEPPTTEKISIKNPTPGDIAKQKCSEYARSVFALVSPTLSTSSKPFNVSLCSPYYEPKLIVGVGGTRAAAKEFPHMAAVGFNSPDGSILWLCGGTLISEKFVLTAAHCTHSSEYKNAAWVRVGDLNIVKSDDDAKPQDRRIIQRIRHPGYKKPLIYHDIALLKMESPVIFDAYVRPACLPLTQNPDSTHAVATGWGRVDWTDNLGSDDLLKMNLPIVPTSLCNTSFGGDDDYRLGRGIIDEYQICAGKEGKDTCQGDSGGPLGVLSSTHYCMHDIIGITSIGRICGSIIPGVYTRVYNYVPWIESVVWSTQ